MSDTEEYDSLVNESRDAWLEKMMKFVMPDDVYRHSQFTSYEKATKKWLEDNNITFAEDGEKLAILRDGKILGTWEPPHAN